MGRDTEGERGLSSEEADELRRNHTSDDKSVTTRNVKHVSALRNVIFTLSLRRVNDLHSEKLKTKNIYGSIEL